MTTDNRDLTQASIEQLGWADLVDCLVCGDDGLPEKPAPDMALAACRQLDIAPARTMVVGDTLADPGMERRAGLAFAVGVTSGVSSRAQLLPLADVVLGSIDEILICA